MTNDDSTRSPPAPQTPRSPWRRLLPTVLLTLFFGALWWRQTQGQSQQTTAVDYSVMYRWAEEGRLDAVVLKGHHLQGKLRAPTTLDGQSLTAFRAELPEHDDGLLPLLRRAGTRISVEREEPSFGVQLLTTLLPWGLVALVWFWLSRRAQGALVRGPLAQMTKNKSHRFDAEKHPDVTFDDIAGLGTAKRDLQEIVQFLKEPERFRRLGAKVPRGVLLVGPPGTGKTLLGRAVAGEAEVPFFSVNASEFVEMFVGLGAARVRDLFEEAKKAAPAIVFIDEIDAVGRARGAGLGMGNDEREQTLNQLLAEMDGFSREQGLIVLAATNRPDVLDPALQRPGRFDRRVIVDRPEVGARRAILAVHTKGKPLAPDVDLQAIAEATSGFSGADLANLVNEAAIFAVQRGAAVIAAADFAAADDKIALGDPREGKLSASERHRVAVHEAGHAVVARFVDGEPPRRVSILPRGMALGVTQQAPAEDRHLLSRSELCARLAVMMGGYAAEQVALGEGSTGAEDDLKRATELATKMTAHYGMSEQVGPMYIEAQAENPFLGRRVATDGGASDATSQLIEEEARHLLVAALAVARDAITRHRGPSDRLIAALLKQETLERADLEEILRDEAEAAPASPPTTASVRPSATPLAAGAG